MYHRVGINSQICGLQSVTCASIMSLLKSGEHVLSGLNLRHSHILKTEGRGLLANDQPFSTPRGQQSPVAHWAICVKANCTFWWKRKDIKDLLLNGPAHGHCKDTTTWMLVKNANHTQSSWIRICILTRPPTWFVYTLKFEKYSSIRRKIK